MAQRGGGPEAEPQRGPLPSAEVARRRGFKLRGRSVRQHIARGVVINAAFTVGFSALGLLKGFILAVFLTQEDYGIWGIAAISLWTLLALKQVGIGDKYIQQDEDDQELAFQEAFTLELMWTAVFVLLLLIALPIVAIVYGESEVIGPGLLLIAALPAGVLQLPIWSYGRSMEFFRQRLLLGVDPIVSFAVSVALAVAGAGYWALPAGLLAGAWCAAAVSLVYTPYRLRLRYRAGTLRSYVSFSWPLVVAALSVILIAQGSILATQATIGLAAAGALTLATTISQFTERVDHVITGTLYPAICAVSGQLDLLRESFVKSNRLALMWAMPFGCGLTLFASDLVSHVLGEEWRSVVVLLEAFGVLAAIGHVGFNWNAYFSAVGDNRPIAITSTAAAVTFLVSLVPLLEAWELEGLAVAVGLQMLVHVAFRAYFLARLFEGFAFLPHALRAMLPTVPGIAAVLLARLLESGERTAAMAAGELGLYVAVVLIATLALERRLLREVAGYLRARPTAGAAA